MEKNLVKMTNGSLAEVKKITAGKSATKRLYEMGLNTGANLKVLKNDHGPIIVGLAGNKVAIGRGLAEKIILV